MPHLSKRKLDLKTEKLLLEAFNSLSSNLSSAEAGKVFSALLSPTERIMIAKRIGMALLIRENTMESEIVESLKLTPATISRYALIIKAGEKSTWDFILNKLERWHELAILKDLLKKAGMVALKKFSQGMAGKI